MHTQIIVQDLCECVCVSNCQRGCLTIFGACGQSQNLMIDLKLPALPPTWISPEFVQSVLIWPPFYCENLGTAPNLDELSGDLLFEFVYVPNSH